MKKRGEPMAAWMIRFDFPEGTTIYAGWAGDALGYAPTPATAAEFATSVIAERTLANSYGEETRPFGRVVRSEKPATATSPIDLAL